MNFRGKVLLNYGNNELFYDVAREYKTHWGEKLFVVDESSAKLFKHASRKTSISLPKT